MFDAYRLSTVEVRADLGVAVGFVLVEADKALRAIGQTAV